MNANLTSALERTLDDSVQFLFGDGAAVDAATPAEAVEIVEPCCEHCREAMELEPDKAILIREKCFFETRGPDDHDAGSILSWD